VPGRRRPAASGERCRDGGGRRRAASGAGTTAAGRP
jgi:hypothetical protein